MKILNIIQTCSTVVTFTIGFLLLFKVVSEDLMSLFLASTIVTLICTYLYRYLERAKKNDQA